jgi:omega-6 fatty acid desaturase (delta-12 desaturase)
MQPRSPHAPTPSELTHLRPSNALGAAVLVGAAALTAASVALSTRPQWWLWLVGQVLLALSLVQWFAILHEAGHETLFRTRRYHALAGQLAGFFSIIPFFTWKRVHGRHHKWTGWQDVDPTTETLVPRELKTAERVLVNVCWRYWIPLFSVMYRVNNFWNWPRLRSLFKSANDRRLIALNSLVLIVVYATIVVLVGPTALLRLIGLGVLLSLIAEDLLLLSQHTHIPQQLSHGEPVRPFPTIEQEVFTRSLVFPAWLSALLLHIDAHELHHMYPFVPGYRLGGIAYETENEIDVWTWIRRARAMPGEIFLFHNRLETGADI